MAGANFLICRIEERDQCCWDEPRVVAVYGSSSRLDRLAGVAGEVLNSFGG
jgi:hypothetical protein